MQDHRIRVCHLIKSLRRGGAEILLAEGLKVANRDRFEFSYCYFLSGWAPVAKALRDEGADVVCFDACSNLAIVAAARRVARYLIANRINVVHAHLPLAGIVARVAGRLSGTPVVYTEHGLVDRYHPVTYWLNLATWAWQVQVLAVSRAVASSLEAHGFDRTPISTILNGVDTRVYDARRFDDEAVRAQLDIPSVAPVVGTVAVFREPKRLDHWLEVAHLVAERRPDAHFLIVGDGTDRSVLEAIACKLKLSEVVHFVGRQVDTGPYYAAMDVYLMTSEFEGLPIALLEAMSMARPSVLTSVGGIPETVEPGSEGLLRAFGDLDGLARDVLTLIESPRLRGSIGNAARARVEQHFSVVRMQSELEAMYERIVASR